MTAAVTVAQAVAAETVLDAAVRIVGFALLAGGAAAAAGFSYRWYAGERIPEGVAVLAGVTIVALWLNTKSALGDAIIGETQLLDPETAIYTVAAFSASTIAADGGRRLGDYLARDVFVAAAPRTFDEMSQLVRSAGRVVAVTLPETIEDADGYDPVDEGTKADLAGETFLFPRGLTVEELHERLASRLEHDYGIGGVDVDLAVDGTVEYLAVGSRPAGIGPTLAPGSVAVAVRADPAADASPGDAVELWTVDDGESRHVTTAELRATAGDVATIALDASRADALDHGRPYRLVTRPGEPDAGRQFVSLLRAADETVTTTTVDPDGLAGESVGSLSAVVLLIERGEDAIVLPEPDARLESGDVVYLLGRPEAIRRLGER